MAWDCRIGFRLNLFHVLILKVLLPHLLILGLIFSNLTPVQSNYVNCDEVHHCSCYRPSGEDWYEIQCPNKELISVYPISVKVYPRDRPDRPGEGTVVLTCDYEKPYFDWRLIRGLDLGKENQGYKITKVSIVYCPVPSKNDSLVELFKHLNIDPGNIKSFSFTSHREIKSIPDDMMSTMVNLTDLDLGLNNLATIPSLEYFPNLKILVLSRNSIEKVTGGTFSSNKLLQQIQLPSNNLSDIEEGSLPRSLTYLNLVTNKISKVTNKTFSHLTSLKYLYLSQNSLEEMDPDAFSNLTQLKILYLDSSKFKTFPHLDNLPSLEVVSMSYNGYYRSLSMSRSKFMLKSTLSSELVTTTSGTIETETTTPSTIVFDQNGEQIDTTTLTNWMIGQSKINGSESVKNNNNNNNSDTSKNFAQSLVEFQVPIKDLPFLKNLTLIYDGLMVVPLLENLPNLTSLILNNNKIQTIPPNSFSSLQSLIKLDLSRNEISTLSDLKVFTLTELDLSKNTIQYIERSVFGMLSNLKKLNLAKNKIKFIDINAFEFLTSLEELDLSHNQINFAKPQPPVGRVTSAYDDLLLKNGSPLKSCRNLRTLNLSYNNLSSIPNDFYYSLLKLTFLNLSHNKFTTLIPQDLAFIQGEIEVDLSYNEISIVNMRYFNVLLDANAQNQVSVKLGGNPLYCNCSLLPFKLFNLKSIEFHMDDLRCSGPTFPKNLTGVKFLSVPKEDLVCPLADNEGCPEKCDCWRRVSDMTIIVDCSDRYNTTITRLPNVNDVNLLRYPDFTKYEFVLNMSGNGINEIPDDYAKELPSNLRAIDLRSNNLRSLSFLRSVGENNTTRFNLSDNPFPCLDCAFHTISRSQFFRIWDSENLTCRVEESATSFQTQKALDYDYESICSSQNFLQVFLPLFIIVCIFVIVIVFYIRHGWAIRAFLYSKGYGRFMCEHDYMDDDQEKVYDAFVSYSHQDEDWVLEELVNKLEEQEGYKICIHTRDWIVGDWIPDQIVRSVDQSRRTVVVLSKNFVESVWSRLEFKAAHSQALTERSNHLILILMGEDLDAKDVKDDDLKVYMKMNTYIKYNDPWFWHKLKYALPHRKCKLDEDKREQYAKKVQRERAIKLDKFRAKIESQTNQISA